MTGEAVATAAVTTRGVRQRFGDVHALDGVDMHVPRGSVYGLVGPNGAGKSTLLSILAGLRRPTAGEVTVDAPHGRIAVLPDTPSFEPWLTARELVDHARVLADPDIDPARVDEALERAGLSSVASRRVGGFSRGMTQRLGLAACIVGEPQLLLLDEPTSALDPAGRRDVLALVRELAATATVVLSSHVLVDIADTCDVVGVLHLGIMRFEGAPGALAASQTHAWTVRLAGHVPDALTDTLARQPWVERAAVIRSGTIDVHAADPNALRTELVRVLADAGVAVDSIEPSTSAFERAFLELTS